MATILVPGFDPEIDEDVRRRWGLGPGAPVPRSLDSPTFGRNTAKPSTSPKPSPGILERHLAALNEGAADTLGAPVDVANMGMKFLGLPTSATPLGGSESIRKMMHSLGIGQVNEAYNPRSEGEVYSQDGARFIGGVAVPSGAIGPTASLLTKGERAVSRAGVPSLIEKYMGQGFSRAQAEYLALPYKGQGHHFIPRKQRVILVKGLPEVRIALPRLISESRFNVLKPKNISRGEMYELHYKADPRFKNANLPARVGGGQWTGSRLGIRRYRQFGRLWHGSPPPLKVAAGASGAVGIGAGTLSLKDDE